ncbi:MAG: hypothetical protein LBS48_05240 [Treponema sp.]|jgi:hypothetical protein|nr:hypothetical protein [Treponema sp.]
MKTVFTAMLLFAVPGFLTAAEITVPQMEMASRGRVEEGEFALGSVISADLALNGGYKYGILLGFDFGFEDLKNIPGGYAGFRTAKATARDLFGSLELSYFIGAGDDFCSGDEFTSRFGIAPIGSDYKGFFYFPEGIGGDITRSYNGIHGVRGAGFSLALTKWERIVPVVYLYENFTWIPEAFGNDGERRYSGDLRVLLNRETVKIEAFGGVSLTSEPEANIRGGLLAHFSAGTGMEFLIQGGIPGWDAGTDFGIDNLFFLMEPRLRFGSAGLNVTFFYHPVEYLHIKTPDERGRGDINVRFFKTKPGSDFTAGLETTMGLKINDMEDFTLWISPFVSFVSSGLLWDAKIRVNPLDRESPAEMFELFFGIRTAF